MNLPSRRKEQMKMGSFCVPPELIHLASKNWEWDEVLVDLSRLFHQSVIFSFALDQDRMRIRTANGSTTWKLSAVTQNHHTQHFNTPTHSTSTDQHINQTWHRFGDA